ncbi:helix-turn-helix domain-containing protein [Methylobacterium durans]|uniref:Helix-turn-helix domain-containing protein n=1 Tax=Methylobacterium durans TaxID=2202825 RepID=A0A2U8W204_9HYPH|nr:helix-turn-helix domain-containing protein [Methylobacterium durans]AWN39661.1 hypothetical protein DK389_02825 [Methylobacterium durans]
MINRSDRFVSIKEARAMLGIGETTIYKLLNQRRIIARKLGGRTFISEAEIARFQASLPAAQFNGNGRESGATSEEIR